MKNIYIGALSGTSMNSLDIAAVRLPDQYPRCPDLVAFAREAMPEQLRQRILNLQGGKNTTLEQSMPEHRLLGQLFARIIRRVIKKYLEPEKIAAIGLHGQTLLHRPGATPPFTLQIGDPRIVAEETQCTTVANFRQIDIDNGGQGAPLAPAFHQAFFAKPEQALAVVNIGGIANITWLESDGKYRGYDCGPGNILMDAWSRRHLAEPYDREGNWARSGTPDKALVEHMLSDEFFTKTPPKSACATYFDLSWLDKKISAGNRISLENVQSSLAEFTAHCIADAILTDTPTSQILVCGGGVHNTYLMERLQTLAGVPVNDTQATGLHPDWVEAAGFAYLAQQRLHHAAVDLRATTGAKKAVLLGTIY